MRGRHFHLQLRVVHSQLARVRRPWIIFPCSVPVRPVAVIASKPGVHLPRMAVQRRRQRRTVARGLCFVALKGLLLVSKAPQAGREAIPPVWKGRLQLVPRDAPPGVDSAEIGTQRVEPHSVGPHPVRCRRAGSSPHNWRRLRRGCFWRRSLWRAFSRARVRGGAARRRRCFFGPFWLRLRSWRYNGPILRGFVCHGGRRVLKIELLQQSRKDHRATARIPSAHCALRLARARSTRT